MDENAEVLSDSSEPFRVRRYRRQLQEVLPFGAAAFHAVEGPPAESTVIPVHEITEEDDPAANSEALCIPHDPLVPAAQSDSNLFDESALKNSLAFSQTAMHYLYRIRFLQYLDAWCSMILGCPSQVLFLQSWPLLFLFQ